MNKLLSSLQDMPVVGILRDIPEGAEESCAKTTAKCGLKAIEVTMNTDAAASIIAKVTRDRLMMEYDKAMPQYHFAANKGYGSAEHIEALAVYGASPIHRRSFITHFKVKE